MIGLFAGRGDVVLAMFLSFIIGCYIGYKFKTLLHKYFTKEHYKKD